VLRELHLRNTGPSPQLDAEFAERLNVFTGDNGLGKSSAGTRRGDGAAGRTYAPPTRGGEWLIPML